MSGITPMRQKPVFEQISHGIDVLNSVRVATTRKIKLQGLFEIDGIQIKEDDLILVKNQKHSGIYSAGKDKWRKVASATGGQLTHVLEGDLNSESVYLCTEKSKWKLVSTLYSQGFESDSRIKEIKKDLNLDFFIIK